MIPEDSSLNEDLIEQIARWHLTGYHGLANGNAIGALEGNRYAVYQQYFLLSHAGLLFAIYHLHPRPEDRLHRRLDLVIVHACERTVCWYAKLVADLLEPRAKSIWTWLRFLLMNFYGLWTFTGSHSGLGSLGLTFDERSTIE